MRINSLDSTLKKNYVQKYQFLIKEYEAVKAKQHPTFKFAKDFYAAHGTCPQTFLKYYARFKQARGQSDSLIPQKRGPRYSTRRTPTALEKIVLEHRQKGCNKYEICAALTEQCGQKMLSPSGVYNVLKRNGKNKMTLPIREKNAALSKR